ncbi:hypothetical protein PC116_g31620 [Phytophthora cactorum]|nr:hypothetical protein PC116_g31620 [Phytophthora cactorum]
MGMGMELKDTGILEADRIGPAGDFIMVIVLSGFHMTALIGIIHVHTRDLTLLTLLTTNLPMSLPITNPLIFTHRLHPHPTSSTTKKPRGFTHHRIIKFSRMAWLKRISH